MVWLWVVHGVGEKSTRRSGECQVVVKWLCDLCDLCGEMAYLIHGPRDAG
jgi:hypothetical protein